MTIDTARQGGLFRRRLDHYPADGPRTVYLAVVVLATIVLYYELYVQGSVATQIIAEFGMTLRYFVVVSVIGNAVGALGSLAAGLADRWGRANIVVVGLFLTGAIVLFGLPNASGRDSYSALFALLSVVEGVILVATPALIRDFSPQLGRASAMGFWTLGPVLGSLVVTQVSSRTLEAHPDWRFQFAVCGVTGLVVAVIALFGLRELAPRLRDQLMVSMRDRALIEARAQGLDPSAFREPSFRQMLTADVVGPAFAISVFLLFYYFAVGFFVIYYAINFGYSEARANSLANWYWITNAIALVITGVVSDRLRVRKPFMVLGSLISAAGVAVFAMLTTHPDTGYRTFAWLLVVISAGGGIAYCAWMAAFTETVERRNPAGTATGLAVWGSILRTVVTVSLLAMLVVVPSAQPLVDHGHRVEEIAAAYPEQVATLGALTPETSEALGRIPDNPAVQATALAEISGLSVLQVERVLGLTATRAQEIETLQAIEPATAARLGADPGDPAAVQAAAGQIAARLGITAKAAGDRLLAASALSAGDLRALQTDGPKIQAAGERLRGISTVPEDELDYLGAHAADVQEAQRVSPGEWQRWWWIAFAGQLVFLPFVVLLAGRWSPARARRDAEQHEAAVERELRAVRATERTPEPAG